MTDTLLKTEYASLTYDAHQGILHHTFFKQAEGDDFRVVINTGVEFLSNHNVTRWLSDDRNLQGFSPDDLNWVLEDWIPRAFDAGWKHWALVVPNMVSARADFLPLIQSVAPRIRVVLFHEVYEAIEWLAVQE